MCKSIKPKQTESIMDQEDISHIVELLTDAYKEKNWDTILDARELLIEHMDDDGTPIELE